MSTKEKAMRTKPWTPVRASIMTATERNELRTTAFNETHDKSLKEFERIYRENISRMSQHQKDVCRDVATSMMFTKSSMNAPTAHRIWSRCSKNSRDYDWTPWLALRLLYYDNQSETRDIKERFKDTEVDIWKEEWPTEWPDRPPGWGHAWVKPEKAGGTFFSEPLQQRATRSKPYEVQTFGFIANKRSERHRLVTQRPDGHDSQRAVQYEEEHSNENQVEHSAQSEAEYSTQNEEDTIQDESGHPTEEEDALGVIEGHSNGDLISLLDMPVEGAPTAEDSRVHELKETNARLMRDSRRKQEQLLELQARVDELEGRYAELKEHAERCVTKDMLLRMLRT